jgi:hypothetical protein
VICQGGPPALSGAAPAKTPVPLGANNPWAVWNQAVASAINAEFQQRTSTFRSQYGGARVPLSVTVKYSVVKQPWVYNKQNLNYHIVITSWNAAAIPVADYGLNSKQLGNMQTGFLNLVESSIYAAQASYQSRLPFPEPVTGDTVAKIGVFTNDPNKPALVYGDLPSNQ